MQKNIYSCDQIDLSYTDFLQLRSQGKVNLGIDNLLAQKVVENTSLRPKTTAFAANMLWNAIALLIFAASVYASFVYNWWWFLIGLFAGVIVAKANQTGTTQNVINAAMSDPEFYDRIKAINGWLYQMNIDDAERHMRKAT